MSTVWSRAAREYGSSRRDSGGGGSSWSSEKMVERISGGSWLKRSTCFGMLPRLERFSQVRAEGGRGGLT